MPISAPSSEFPGDAAAVVAHAHEGLVVVEFEPERREEASRFHVAVEGKHAAEESEDLAGGGAARQVFVDVEAEYVGPQVELPVEEELLNVGVVEVDVPPERLVLGDAAIGAGVVAPLSLVAHAQVATE